MDEMKWKAQKLKLDFGYFSCDYYFSHFALILWSMDDIRRFPHKLSSFNSLVFFIFIMNWLQATSTRHIGKFRYRELKNSELFSFCQLSTRWLHCYRNKVKNQISASFFIIKNVIEKFSVKNFLTHRLIDLKWSQFALNRKKRKSWDFHQMLKWMDLKKSEIMLGISFYSFSCLLSLGFPQRESLTSSN